MAFDMLMARQRRLIENVFPKACFAWPCYKTTRNCDSLRFTARIALKCFGPKASTSYRMLQQKLLKARETPNLASALGGHLSLVVLEPAADREGSGQEDHV